MKTNKTNSNFINVTSYFAHFQNSQNINPNQKSNTNELTAVQTIKVKTKKQVQFCLINQSKQLIQNLIKKLTFMEEKQKQTQIKFQQCLKCLKSQLEIKDKKNLLLKQQIASLKQQLTKLKKSLPSQHQQQIYKYTKDSHNIVINSFIKQHYGLAEKQNMPNEIMRECLKVPIMAISQKNRCLSGQMSKKSRSFIKQCRYKKQKVKSKNLINQYHNNISPYNINQLPPITSKPTPLNQFNLQQFSLLNRHPTSYEHQSIHDDYNTLLINSKPIQQFRQQQKNITNNNNKYLDSSRININKFQQQERPLSRKKKSKSFGGLLKSKLFVMK